MKTSTAVVLKLLMPVKPFGLNLSYCGTSVEYLPTVIKKKNIIVLSVMYSEYELSVDSAKRLG